MSDQNLELSAVVVDKFSKPITDLQNRLKNFKPTPAMKATAQHFDNLKKQIEAAGKAIRDAGSGLAGGMGLPGVSIGALGAAGAIAALSANVRSFATQTVAMKNFARDTGIATAKLKELQAVSSGLGLDPEAMKGAVEFAARNTDYLRRKQGTYQELAALGPGGRSIAADLAGTTSNDQALEKILGYIQNQKDPAQRRTLGRLLLGNEDAGVALGNESSASFTSRRSAARASISQQSKADEESAKAFLDSTDRVSAALDKIKLSVGGALAPNLTALADAMAAFANNHSGDAKKFFDGVSATLSSHNWNEDAVAIALVFEKTKAFIDYMTSLSPKMEQFKKDRGSAADGDNYSLFGNTLGARKGSVFDWLLQHAPKWDQLDGKPFMGVTPKPSAPGPTKPDTTARDDYSPIAYRPGARAVFSNMARAQDTVATIAAGVTKGMQDFAQSLQGGTGAPGGAGGGGFQNASYTPPPAAKAAINGMRAVRQSLGVTTPQYDAGVPDDGQKRFGGSRSWRNRNPGNIEFGPFARSHGAIGTDGRFAIFPSEEAGRSAQEALLFDSKGYRDLTLGQAIHRWAPGFENNVPAYIKAMGLDPNTKMRDFSPAQRRQLLANMRKHEGWKVGRTNAALPAPTASTDRPSASRSKAKADAAAAGRDGLHGRVSIDVQSKDHPVSAKTDGSPLFQELSIKRGNLMSI